MLSTMSQLSPGPGVQGGRRMASSGTPARRARLDRALLHGGGEGMGGVDEDADALFGQIVGKTLDPAEAAAPHRSPGSSLDAR